MNLRLLGFDFTESTRSYFGVQFRLPPLLSFLLASSRFSSHGVCAIIVTLHNACCRLALGVPASAPPANSSFHLALRVIESRRKEKSEIGSRCSCSPPRRRNTCREGSCRRHGDNVCRFEVWELPIMR